MNLNSHITKFLVASVLSVTASGALSQDVTGQWRTEPGDDGGHLVVEISKCGNEICGTILDAINKDNQRISNYEYRGKQMIWCLSPLELCQYILAKGVRKHGSEAIF